MDTTIKNEAPKHWAAKLKENDYVIATIRHKTDGEKNLCDVLCKVVDNNEQNEKCILLYKRTTYVVGYCELTDISKLVQNNYKQLQTRINELEGTIENNVTEVSEFFNDGVEIFECNSCGMLMEENEPYDNYCHNCGRKIKK